MPPADDDQASQETAGWVLEKATGLRPTKVAEETEGLTNQVFRADTGKGSFIVRLGLDADKLDVYERERAVIDRVRAVGVPVAEVIAVGLARERPFMVARRVPGEAALHHPRRPDILVEVGRLAARIHTVRTTGYGPSFGWPGEADPDQP